MRRQRFGWAPVLTAGLLLIGGCFGSTPQRLSPGASVERLASLAPVGVDSRWDPATGFDIADRPLSPNPQFIIRAINDDIRSDDMQVAIRFDRYDAESRIDPHWRLVFYDRHASRRVGWDSPFGLTMMQDGRELWTPFPSPGRGLIGHRFDPGRYRALLSVAAQDGCRAEAGLIFSVE